MMRLICLKCESMEFRSSFQQEENNFVFIDRCPDCGYNRKDFFSIEYLNKLKQKLITRRDYMPVTCEHDECRWYANREVNWICKKCVHNKTRESASAPAPEKTEEKTTEEKPKKKRGRPPKKKTE